MANILDGTRMVYTYTELGTVRVSYENGYVGFEWTAGLRQGEAGQVHSSVLAAYATADEQVLFHSAEIEHMELS